jgi:DNA-binding response OmpR family regulator
VSDANETSPRPVRVLVYSDDRNVRDKVRFAIGKRPAKDLGPFEYVECATQPAVLKAADAGGLDVLVLDGEAVPAGGMGLARQLKDEIFRCPPIMVLTGRPQDAWLATWSRAEAALPHPLDAVALAKAVVELAKQRQAALPATA